MPNIGPFELIVVLVIALLILGPKKLPGLGKSLGTGMREFKESITGGSKDDEKSIAAGDNDDDEPATSEQHDERISRPRG